MVKDIYKSQQIPTGKEVINKKDDIYNIFNELCSMILKAPSIV